MLLEFLPCVISKLNVKGRSGVAAIALGRLMIRCSYKPSQRGISSRLFLFFSTQEPVDPPWPQANSRCLMGEGVTAPQKPSFPLDSHKPLYHSILVTEHA